MNTRLISLLLVLFFGGLLALWVADYRRIPTEAQRQRQYGRVLPELIDVPLGEVTRVEILGGDRHLVFERREAGRWQMIEPSQVLADASKLETLLANLRALPVVPDSGPVSGRPDEFGLDKPSWRVRLFGADALRPIAALKVGRIVQSLRYVQNAAASSMEVVDAQSLSLLEQPTIAWRERALFSTGLFEATGLAVQARDPERRPLEASRSEGHWHLLRPVKALADDVKVDQLVGELVALGAMDGENGFVADNVKDLGKYGLNPPRIRVDLTTRGGSAKPHEALFGDPVPGKPDRVYAKRGDQDDILMVDSKVLADLGKRPNALRSRKVADFDTSTETLIEVREEGRAHLLVKVDRIWKERIQIDGTASLVNADNDLISGLLKALNDLEAFDFLDESAASRSGVVEPRLTIKVWSGKSAETNSSEKPAFDLRLGRHDATGKIVFGQTPDDKAIKTVLALPDSLLSSVPTGTLAFRDRTIVPRTGEMVASIRVSHQGKTVAAEPTASPLDFKTWRLVEPIEAPADAPTLSAIAKGLSNLRAEALVTESSGEAREFGVDEPEILVAWTSMARVDPARGKSVQATTKHELRIGKAVPGRNGERYAKLAGHTMIYTIDPKTITVLTTEMHDKRVMSFAVDRVKSVVLRWPDRTIRLVRGPLGRDGHAAWVADRGSDASGFEPVTLTSLLGDGKSLFSLSALVTPRFVQYKGPIPPEYGLTPPSLAVRILMDGGDSGFELLIGREGPQNMRYATTSTGASGAVFLLPGSVWDVWVRSPGQPANLPDDVFAP